MVKQGLQSPVANRGAAQAERVDMLGCEGEGVDDIQGVFVGGADQSESVESAPDERVVEFAAIAAWHLAQLATLQRGQQAAPVARTAVQCVPPLDAHLGKDAPFVGGEVLEEAAQKAIVEHQLLDAVDRRRVELVLHDQRRCSVDAHTAVRMVQVRIGQLFPQLQRCTSSTGRRLLGGHHAHGAEGGRTGIYSATRYGYVHLLGNGLHCRRGRGTQRHASGRSRTHHHMVVGVDQRGGLQLEMLLLRLLQLHMLLLLLLLLQEVVCGVLDLRLATWHCDTPGTGATATRRLVRRLWRIGVAGGRSGSSGRR